MIFAVIYEHISEPAAVYGPPIVPEPVVLDAPYPAPLPLIHESRSDVVVERIPEIPAAVYGPPVIPTTTEHVYIAPPPAPALPELPALPEPGKYLNFLHDKTYENQSNLFTDINCILKCKNQLFFNLNSIPCTKNSHL